MRSLSPEEFQRRKIVFEAALELPPAERAARVAELCGDDAPLAEDVLLLLRNADVEDEFLDSVVARPPQLEAGRLLCERFELLRLAGEGGMGQVWMARDRRLGETVAVKTIHHGTATEEGALTRLKRELQLARRVGHPNVCRVYELFEDQSTSCVFLTMEFLEGETLAARLRREGRLVPAEALRLFEQIAAGLSAAHATGIVHRDLKPSNVMLTADAATGREKAVVMDFGLARALDPSVSGDVSATRTGTVMGTFEYMAPEQIRAEPATPAADVYTLGLLLFEMLDGRAPFQGKNTMDTWMRRMREGPPPLAADNRIPGLDPRVDQVIARCLQYDPVARFASPLEAVASLQAGVLGARAWPWPTPSRRLLLSAVAVCCLAVAAIRLLPAWRRSQVPDEARQWYEDAQRALSEGAAARATAELRRALQRAPNFAAAHAAMAEAQLELDQVYAARESIQRAAYLARGGGSLPAMESLHVDGVNLLILRDCAKAVDAFARRSQAVESEFRPTALASLARAQERCEMTGDARKTLEHAMSEDSRNAAVKVRLAYLLSRSGDRDSAARLLDEAESVYRERANFEGVAEVLATRGTLAAERDQLDDAMNALVEALALARTTRSVHQEVRVLLQQAIVARKRGDMASAEKLTVQGLDLARRNDLETLAMQGLFTAANVHFSRNQLDQAEAAFQRALEIAVRYRDEGGQARAWLSLASMNARRGQPDAAADLIAKARPYYENTGNQRVMAQLEALETRLNVARANMSAVLAFYQRKLSHATKAKDDGAAGDARRGL